MEKFPPASLPDDEGDDGEAEEAALEEAAVRAAGRWREWAAWGWHEAAESEAGAAVRAEEECALRICCWINARERALFQRPFAKAKAKPRAAEDKWAYFLESGRLTRLMCSRGEVSTGILGRRTAPFPPLPIFYRVPHGFTPRS